MKTLLTLIIGLGLICSSLADQTNEPPTVTPQLFSRVFHLDSIILNQMRLQVPPKPGETSQDYLLRYFKTHKIEFKKPAYLKFEDASGRLIVKNTVDDLDKIENLVSKPIEK